MSWSDALLLESLGQAIRGAAFAIPGALGVQEGGYLLLAPLVGLAAGCGARAVAREARARAPAGLPGLLYLHFCERGLAQHATRRLRARNPPRYLDYLAPIVSRT